jgi:uncharacterized membrane protein YdjX (TVP38/TMEM64 family)
MPDFPRHVPHPSIDDFVFEGEATPLLFKKRVVGAVALVFVACVVAYFALSSILGFSTEINAKPFQEWIDGKGAWGPVLFVLVMAVSVLFAPIPNVPIFIAAGLAWGPVEGSVYAMAGLMLGSAMAFYASRFAGRRHLPRLIGAKMAQRLDTLAETMGGRVIFWSRMLPAINFDWISFVAGMTAIRFWVFFVYSFLGMLLPTVVVVVAGDGLGRDLRLTLTMGGVWVVGIVASAAYFWQRRRRWIARRRAAERTVAEIRKELGSVG